MDRIIAKYLAGDLSLEDQHKLSKWLEEDDQNVETLRTLELYWMNYRTNHKAERKEVEERIISETWGKPQVKNDTRWFGAFTIYKIAAAAVIALATVLVIYTNLDKEIGSQESKGYVEKVSLPGQNITTKLPDGTMVRLNGNSKLITPETFDGENRVVKLIGEAFFDVTRNESKPFIIQTNNFTIRVLGTSFNVKAYPNLESNHVAVMSGKVSVKANSKKLVELNPDQMVNITGKGNLSKISLVDKDLIFGWTERYLVFKDNNLEEVFGKIESWYGLKIDREAVPVSDKSLTASFKNPSVNEVMTHIAKIYFLEYYMVNDKLIKISLKE